MPFESLDLTPMTLRDRLKNAPIRFWMTGALAVVVAVLSSSPSRAAQERQMMTTLSRHSVAQTAQLIEAKARSHGLGVFVRYRQPAARGQEGAGETLVLVLESSRGGTPVVMVGEGDQQLTELPLRLELRGRADGASEVLIPSAGLGTELPAELAADLAELPTLVADAIG